jgi:DNA-binding response OmpR family regulator
VVPPIASGLQRAYFGDVVPAKVLVVSPDAHLREELAQVLLRHGLVVDQVRQEADALTACTSRRPPDFILLDSTPPPAPEVLDQLEQACQPTQTTIVVLTQRKLSRRWRKMAGAAIQVDRPGAISDVVGLSRMIEQRYRDSIQA